MCFSNKNHVFLYSLVKQYYWAMHAFLKTMWKSVVYNRLTNSWYNVAVIIFPFILKTYTLKILRLWKFTLATIRETECWISSWASAFYQFLWNLSPAKHGIFLSIDDCYLDFCRLENYFDTLFKRVIRWRSYVVEVKM